MTEIRVTQTQDALVITAEGHAGFAGRGEDVVCAGISALLCGTAAYLADLVRAGGGTVAGGASGEKKSAACDPDHPAAGRPRLDREIRPGHLKLSASGLPAGLPGHTAAQLCAGLGLIAEAYPAYLSLYVDRERI